MFNVFDSNFTVGIIQIISLGLSWLSLLAKDTFLRVDFLLVQIEKKIRNRKKLGNINYFSRHKPNIDLLKS